MNFMKTAYFDAFSGLSGDMIAGAILDAGADFAALKATVAALRLPGCRLSTHRKSVSGIEALKFDVDVFEPDSGVVRRLPKETPGADSVAAVR